MSSIVVSSKQDFMSQAQGNNYKKWFDVRILLHRTLEKWWSLRELPQKFLLQIVEAPVDKFEEVLRG